MRISYNKLWKMLIDKNMKKSDLKEKAGISSASLAKLGKGDNITTDQLSIQSYFFGIVLSAQKAWKRSEQTSSIFLLRIIMMILLIPFFTSTLKRSGKSI